MNKETILENKVKDIISIKDGSFHQKEFTPVVVLFEDGIAIKHHENIRPNIIELDDYVVCETNRSWNFDQSIHNFLFDNLENKEDIKKKHCVLLTPFHVIVTKFVDVLQEQRSPLTIHFHDADYSRGNPFMKYCYKVVLHSAKLSELKGE